MNINNKTNEKWRALDKGVIHKINIHKQKQWPRIHYYKLFICNFYTLALQMNNFL